MGESRAQCRKEAGCGRGFVGDVLKVVLSTIAPRPRQKRCSSSGVPKTQKSHMRELIESASEDGRITFPKIRSLPWALQYQVKCQSIVSRKFSAARATILGLSYLQCARHDRTGGTWPYGVTIERERRLLGLFPTIHFLYTFSSIMRWRMVFLHASLDTSILIQCTMYGTLDSILVFSSECIS